MTKEQYLEIRHDELQLLFHHMKKHVKLPYFLFVGFAMTWQRLMIGNSTMMNRRFKIDITPSQAYEQLVMYYDRQFELQLLYDNQGNLIKIIT